MVWPDILALIGRFFQGAGWAILPVLILPFLLLILPGNRLINSVSRALLQTGDGISYFLGEAVKWLLPALVLSIAFSVFALSIFGLSWTKLFESAEYMHASVIMLGAAATLLAGQHVRVDIFHTNMSARSKALVDFCGYYILLVPVCLVLLWNSQSFISFTWLIFEGSAEADGIRGEFLLKTLIPIFALMMLLQGLAIALRAALVINDLAEPECPPHTPPLFGDQEIQG